MRKEDENSDINTIFAWNYTLQKVSALEYHFFSLIVSYPKPKYRAARVAQRFSAAFGPGRDPGDLGSSPTSGRCMEPASPSACVSPSLSLSLCVSLINK